MKSIISIPATVVVLVMGAARGTPLAPTAGPSVESTTSSCAEKPEAAVAAGGLQGADADMGCCVLKTQNVACTYTNRKYCQTKAQEARVSYDFHKDTSCRDVGGCPAKDSGPVR